MQNIFTDDEGFKIRPLITRFQKSSRKFGIFEENLAVDEMIVRYYGHNSLKQFIQAKTIRFGYKLWALYRVPGWVLLQLQFILRQIV